MLVASKPDRKPVISARAGSRSQTNHIPVEVLTNLRGQVQGHGPFEGLGRQTQHGLCFCARADPLIHAGVPP